MRKHAVSVWFLPRRPIITRHARSWNRSRLFDTVLGSDGRRNLKGRQKAPTNRRSLRQGIRLCRQFECGSGDLASLSGCDSGKRAPRGGTLGAPCWQRRAGISPPRNSVSAISSAAMRFYQWVKNLLLFVPAITSHTIFDVPVAGKTALAFFAFALCASAGYILNDLLGPGGGPSP